MSRIARVAPIDSRHVGLLKIPRGGMTKDNACRPQEFKCGRRLIPDGIGFWRRTRLFGGCRRRRLARRSRDLLLSYAWLLFAPLRRGGFLRGGFFLCGLLRLAVAA